MRRALFLLALVLFTFSVVYAYPQRTVPVSITSSGASFNAVVTYTFFLKSDEVVTIPSAVYRFTCTSDDINYVREVLLDHFVSGAFVSPVIVRDGTDCYALVYTAFYHLMSHPNGYYYIELNIADGRLTANGHTYDVSGLFRRFPYDSRRGSSYTIPIDGYQFIVNVPPFSLIESTSPYYLAFDGSFFSPPDYYEHLDELEDDYEDPGTCFHPLNNPVLLNDTTYFTFTDCHVTKSYTYGKNYLTAHFGNYGVGKDIYTRRIGTYYYIYGAAPTPLPYITTDLRSITTSQSFLSPENVTDLMLGGIAGAESVAGILGILEETALPFTSAAGLFIVGFAATYFIIKFSYEFVKKRNPKLLPFFWLMTFLFGDIGAIATAALALFL